MITRNSDHESFSIDASMNHCIFAEARAVLSCASHVPHTIRSPSRSTEGITFRQERYTSAC